MTPVLDEVSLVPCPANSVPVRVRRLAETLRALDGLGVPRSLRSVRDAPDRDLGEGRGLRSWCFDRHSERDAGLLVALRLGAAPYIDGPDGLFAAAEGGRAVEADIGGTTVLGAGLVALSDGLLVMLHSDLWPPTRPVMVQLDFLDDDHEWSEDVEITAVDSEGEVAQHREVLLRKVDRSVSDGHTLVQRLGELCPRVRLGQRAEEQIAALLGTEAYFGQVIRHLRALDQAAEAWSPGTPYEPAGVTFSVESGATLDHGTYGPMRDFPAPDGFPFERWSLHTKLTGGPGARLYYRAHDNDGSMVVLVGYLGSHLPTVRFG